MSVGGSASVDSLQLWILTSVVEGKWYFPVLTSAKRYARQSNYRIPSVDGSTLVDAVECLLSSGLLMAERHKQRVPWENRARIESWIGAEPFTPDTVHFGLTPEGGAYWERACQADWSRFLNGTGSQGEMVDVDKGMFTTFCHHEGATLYRTWEYARRSDISHWDKRLMSRGRELKPWKATYWKTLPTGHRLS